jgi:hypothetical protein
MKVRDYFQILCSFIDVIITKEMLSEERRTHISTNK